MKTSFIVFLFLLTTLSGHSQNSDKELWDKANLILETNGEIYYDYFNSKEIDKKTLDTLNKKWTLKALIFIDQILKEYPNSELYNNALLIKAENELAINNKAVSKAAFNELLSRSNLKRGMKYNSYIGLAWIAIDEQNFKLANEYLTLAENNPKNYSCGTEYYGDKERLNNMRKICISGGRK
ncbi:hypothetical protein HUK80_17390 [Flavobacterium sp. MAH-1]|uniref:Tetratricopeptide repeat-containing protein n=1 Tax=Flavobacterium agri TaxID=2743471 RepID=A0A7Y8Y6A1_9FLAO|nr:hypothetical protein [Flavobacterium agri]NUY82680.1 hypothetical protein [Flavobacterium agri]NYA72703.1 hypothetical protein [Flavobacterium agri]